jgi:hypothetical protein
MVRSPKFIWAPCAQLYSLAETPQIPTSLHIWAHRRYLIVNPCSDQTILRMIPRLEEMAPDMGNGHISQKEQNLNSVERPRV